MSLSSLEHLKRRITVATGVIAVIVGVSVPFGYFVVGYDYESRRLQSNADLVADRLSQFAHLHPDTWRFQEPRLVALMRLTQARDTAYRQRLRTADGQVVAAIEKQPAAPLLRRNGVLLNDQQAVGQIEIEESLRPLLLRTMGVGIAALLLAFAAYIVMRVLPLRALARALNDLDRSRRALETEIRAKEQALRKAQEIGDEMRHLALHDPLTGLPNRAFFQDRLQYAIAAGRRDNRRLSVMLMDLDGFKEVNDSLGHHMGDLLLQEVSARLRHTLRQSDIVARLGGDEFAVVLADADDEGAFIVAHKILQAFDEPFALMHNPLVVRASIGIAHFPGQAQTGESLVQNADLAMYQAKRTGSGVALYQPEQHEHSRNRLRLVNELRRAADNDDFFLCFQPKIDLDAGTIIGVEALLRWQHPEEGVIFPDVFIPLAEQAGLMSPVTRWVIKAAVAQAVAWRSQAINLSIAVNLSAQNLMDKDLPAYVHELLHESGIGSDTLVFEITESAIMADLAAAMDTITRLHALGIRLAIDDFGTGYSSLYYLKKLPVDELKIDRSFVMQMRDDTDDKMIVHSTIDLAHNLGLTVTAEGVEDGETYDLLRALGCNAAQGYYIARPMAAAQLPQWLTQSPWAARGASVRVVATAAGR
jgi:diguanylate cyclase (GGDEF)-like protein